MKKLKIAAGTVLSLAVVAIFLWQKSQFNRANAEIANLKAQSVESVQLYYERDWFSGSKRIVDEPEKIEALIESLKTGKRYYPSHDQHNGFERAVIIEPQRIHFQIYQKKGDDSCVIVGLGKRKGKTGFLSFGYIRCPSPQIWKSL